MSKEKTNKKGNSPDEGENNNSKDGFKAIEITEELQESYIDYAMSVIISRAIPDIRDGLKPVQRRILWAMWDDSLTYQSKFRKSASVVGQVLGRYHPHGDSAVYDAMARMAQDFSLRYPLIDGQGNWGSIDGDNQAAMRYTECRLTKISGELLDNVEKDTVDWSLNYDNTRQEPNFLPAKLPGLLLNGTMGIAVGMATSIPPHNLSEIIDATKYLIDKPDATVKELMSCLPGPDFPTGGEIYNTEELERAYSTGRGSVVIRAITDIEKRGNHMVIVVDEIPYQVNKSKLIQKIAHLVQDKKVQGIRDIQDESSHDGMRITIKLKQGINPQRVLNQLFKNTELQKKFHFNMVALVNGIQPQVVSLKDILSEYLKHRKKTITRRIKYKLKKAEDRAHILEGLVVALEDINAVIKTIKKSKDRAEAYKNLIKKFNLSKIQTEAILNMKLQSLASLESKKIKDELKEKKELIKEFKAILKNKQKILEIIIEELDEIKEKYGDERRTKMVKGSLKDFKDEDFIPKKETVILLTNDGYIKRMPPESFRAQGRGGRGLKGFDLKEEDKVAKLIVANTHDDVFFFTKGGSVLKSRVYEIPASTRTTKGKLVHTFLGISDEDKITAILTYDNKGEKEKHFVMGTEKGMVKKTKISEFKNVRTTGIIAINLKDKDTLKWVKRSTGEDNFLFVTRNGRSIRFKESEIRSMGRTASGVKAINLKGEDKVASFVIINEGKNKEGEKLLVITDNGYGKKTPLKEYKVQRRGGRGIATSKINKKTGFLTAASLIDNESQDLIAFSAKGLVIKTDIKNIRTSGRATQGVRIMKINDDDALIGIFCS